MLGLDFQGAAQQALKGEVGPDPDPEIAELKNMVKDLTIKLTQKEQDEATAKAAAAAQAARDEGKNAIVTYVKSNDKAYPMLAKNPAWVAQALDHADKAYAHVVSELKKAGQERELTVAEKNQLIEESLKQTEAYHVEQAKAYGQANPVPNQVPARGTPTVTSDIRGGIEGKPVGKPGKMTLEQVKARRAQQARQ
jgi:hypothetical protein